MFLLRSGFWLTAAFLVLGPSEVDFGPTIDALSVRANAAGQQALVAGVSDPACRSLECLGGKALVAAVAAPSPSGVTAMQDSPVPVPAPRPRPGWMG